MYKFLLFLTFILISACKVETPVDLQSQILNQNSFKYTQDKITIYKTLSEISTKPILPYATQYAYSISPSLPNGLTINAFTGEITGVPDESIPPSVFTVTAENSRERIYSSINLTVLEQPITSFNYVEQFSTNYVSNVIGYTSVPITTIEPLTTGGNVDAFEISLDDQLTLANYGLTFSSSGVISGIPTNLTTQNFNITVTAKNQSTTITKLIRFTLNQQAPTSISYSASYVLNVGSTITTISPSLTGGSPNTFSITPNLPPGLSFNTYTGTINGTPTENAQTAQYTVVARNDSGAVSTFFQLEVVDVAPNGLSYLLPSPSFGVVSLPKDSVFIYYPPTLGPGSGTPTNYSISPSLPDGLTINNKNGIIQGTPTSISARTTYTVYASNLYGVSSISFDFEVVEVPPSNLSYNIQPSYLKNQTITPITPTYNGSVPNIFRLKIGSNPLPAGLSLNSQTGYIEGTPTQSVTAYQVTIEALNNANSSSPLEITLYFTIFDLAPTGLSYTETPGQLIPLNCNQLMAPLVPSVDSNGGVPLSYSYNSSQIALPPGIQFDSSTGIFSDTPTAATGPLPLIIAGTNSTGTASTQLTIKVYPETPVISYPLAQMFAGYTSTLTPTMTHCLYNEKFSVNKPMPSGITFDPLNGSFSVSSLNKNIIMRDDYTVTAKNTGYGSYLDVNNILVTGEMEQKGEAIVRLGVDYVGTSDAEIVFTDFINFNNDQFSDIVIIEKKCPLLCTNAYIKIFTGTQNGAFIPHVFNTQTNDTILDITDIFANETNISNPPLYFNIKKVKSVYYNDGDFLTDLVLIEETSNTVIFLQNKQNDLASPRQFKYFGHALAPSNVNDVAVLDVDQDFVPEVVLSNSSHILYIYKFNNSSSAYDIKIQKSFYQLKGNNDGQSARGVGSMSSFEVNDLNSDGIFDLVIADELYKRICFIIGTGDNTYFNDSCIHTIEPSREPIEIKSDDIDGDSISDLAVLLRDGTLQIYKGDGDIFNTYDGSVPPAYEKKNIITNATAGKLNLSDTNADCIKDIQILDTLQNRVINYKISASANQFEIPQYMEFNGISNFTVGSRYTDPSTSSFIMIACNKANNYCAIPEHLGNQPDIKNQGCGGFGGDFGGDFGSDDGVVDDGFVDEGSDEEELPDDQEEEEEEEEEEEWTDDWF